VFLKFGSNFFLLLFICFLYLYVLFVIEYYPNSNRLVVLREKRNREDLLSGDYSILVVEEKKTE
jgi:hypothetical protein